MASLIPPECLAAATIRGEAGMEPYEGKLAVGKTIRNRMARRHFSDGTVAGTVLKPYQFSLWNTNDKGRIRACLADDSSPQVEECKRAWAESETWDGLPPEVVYYHADYVRPSWADTTVFVRKIGRHLFYKDRERS